jgi:hypothetical protein
MLYNKLFSNTNFWWICKIRRQINNLHLSTCNELPWFCGSYSQNNSIILLSEPIKRVHGISSNTSINNKIDTFLGHKVHPPLNYIHFVSLHVWNTIHHKPSNSVSTLIHSHYVTYSV